MGRRPGKVVCTALLGASRVGEDAVEICIGYDVQVERGVCDLGEDVEFAQVE